MASSVTRKKSFSRSDLSERTPDEEKDPGRLWDEGDDDAEVFTLPPLLETEDAEEDDAADDAAPGEGAEEGNAPVVAGVALERAADDRRQRVDGQRLEPQRLIDELRDRREEMLDLAQVVLTKDEQQLDRQRLAQQPHEHLDDAALHGDRILLLLEERDDLLELVEDQQRAVRPADLTDAILEGLHGHDDPRCVVFGSRQQRRQVIALVLRRRDPLDDDLLAAARLHACPLGLQLAACRGGQQAGIDQRGLPIARGPIQQHSAIDRDEVLELLGLLLTRQEDRVIDVPKRLDPAKRDRRQTDDRPVRDGYGESSLPSTSSYRRGANAHTSWAMNFT